MAGASETMAGAAPALLGEEGGGVHESEGGEGAGKRVRKVWLWARGGGDGEMFNGNFGRVARVRNQKVLANGFRPATCCIVLSQEQERSLEACRYLVDVNVIIGTIFVGLPDLMQLQRTTTVVIS